MDEKQGQKRGAQTLSKEQHVVEQAPERALAVIFPQGREEEVSMAGEIQGLLETMGAVVLDIISVNLREPNPRFLVGSGKTHEIMETARAMDADIIVIDHELSPSQQRNWEKESGTAVIDRHEVILEIFAQRAQTREAVLQTALARLQYSLPRLTRLWTELSQQRGGAKASRGAGETQLELDRRRVQLRIDKIQDELKTVQKHRMTARKSRMENLITSAAIVGYTNAGKSSLLNLLTLAGVSAQDKLFATLDPVTRKYTPAPGQELLLTDTVGFVSRLPHQLVDAFRATLEESLNADFLIHVADASDPALNQNLKVVEDVISDLGAGDKPRLLVLNKTDKLENPSEKRMLEIKLPQAVLISVKLKTGMEELKAGIMGLMEKTRLELKFLLPLERGDLLNLLHHHAWILEEDYRDDGVFVRALSPPALKGRLAHWLVPEETL